MIDKERLDLLLHWARNAKRAQFAHYRMANRYGRLYKINGVIVTIVAVVTGSSVIANFSKTFPNIETLITIVTGLLILLAGSLSGIQTFMKLEERSGLHRGAGASYSGLKRQLDQWIAIAKKEDINNSELDGMRTKFDELGVQSPQVSDSVWRKVLKDMPSLDFEHYQIDNHAETDN